MNRCLLPKRNRVTERREKATETFDGPLRSSLIHAYSRPFDPCYAPTTVFKDGRTLCVWYEFVFSLSLAIKEVETKEKNNPKENKNIINNKITLSTLFHQS